MIVPSWKYELANIELRNLRGDEDYYQSRLKATQAEIEKRLKIIQGFEGEHGTKECRPTIKVELS